MAGLTHRDCLDLISILDGVYGQVDTAERLAPNPSGAVGPSLRWLLDLRARLIEEAKEKPH